MNLADYLSELLGQYDEVSVPGLGYFVRERVNGHYNDKEAKFYPPYHQVKFVEELKDDDTFAQYVADKKNISLASSKYFAEKFISKLREQALAGQYVFADLGFFYMDQSHQLIFKPHEKMTPDPAFYGYAPVNTYKINQPSTGVDIKQIYTEPVSAPVVTPPPVQIVEKQQYFEEETERKRPLNIWLVLLIALAVVTLGLFGIYKFYPAAFDKISSAYNKITGKKEDTAVPVYRHEIKADTIKKAAPVKDTATKTGTPKTMVVPVSAATKVDSVKATRFEIVAGSFKGKIQANAAVAYFKTKGIDAKIIVDAPGPRKKISAGTYDTKDEAETQRLALIKAHKISKKSYTLQITPL